MNKTLLIGRLTKDTLLEDEAGTYTNFIDYWIKQKADREKGENK